MAKENSKSTEEAIADHENRQNVAGISKIDQNLAITQKDKSSAPSGNGVYPGGVCQTVDPPGECGKHTTENYANLENKALHLKKSSDETGSAFLSPVRIASMQNNLQNTRENLGNAGIKLTCYKGTAFLKLTLANLNRKQSNVHFKW